jgi:hypothetical protein
MEHLIILIIKICRFLEKYKDDYTRQKELKQLQKEFELQEKLKKANC